MKPEEIDKERLDVIIERYRDEKWGLIPLLQDVQEAFGFIPPECIVKISRALSIPPAVIQGVVTFYSGFSLEPKGKHVFRVCCGTACHVKGGQSVLRLMQKELDLEKGQTSPDYQYTLETVACLGACFLAPAILVNREYYGKLNPTKIKGLLAQYGKY